MLGGQFASSHARTSWRNVSIGSTSISQLNRPRRSDAAALPAQPATARNPASARVGTSVPKKRAYGGAASLQNRHSDSFRRGRVMKKALIWVLSVIGVAAVGIYTFREPLKDLA